MTYSSLGECIAAGVKAHVLYSRILSDDEYWGLLNCDTVGEITDKLRGSNGYHDHLANLPPGDVRRYDLEAALKSSLLFEADSFIIHLSNPRDRFFRSWVAWYEAENLKSIFRFVASKRENRDDLRRRLFVIPGSKVNYEIVLGARDFGELADALRATPYYRIASEPLKRLASGEEQTLFPLEMAVDNYVELQLYKSMMKLDPAERKPLMPLFGSRIDLMNLYILFRALAFYKMTPEETLNRLLPVRYRVQLKHLRELGRSESTSVALDTLKSMFPVYAEVVESTRKEEETQLALERNIKRFSYKQAMKCFRTGSPGFHTAIGYFLLREFEIQDLIHIIEDVRYGFDRRHAAAYLIRPILSGGDS